MATSCIQFLEETAQKFPNKVAISCKLKSLTFKELSNSSKNLSAYLPNKIINSPIAILLPKSCDSVVAFMAALYSGNFYVPIDIKSPKGRIIKILDNLNPIAVITHSDLDPEIKDQLPACSIIVIDKLYKKEKSIHVPQNWKRILDVDPIYCIYTSGSTGDPKGVLISHQGVLDFIHWAIETYLVDSRTRIANQVPFHFDMSTLDIYLMLSLGAELFLVPETYFSFPARLLDYLQQKRISFIFWVPSALLNIANLNILKDRKLPELNKILFAGEVMPVKCVNHWRKYFPKALMSNLYGPTEITVICTYYILNRKHNNTDDLPIGIPCKNTAIFLLNDQNQLVQNNEIGEICVRGKGLALGYWNLPDKTVNSFIQNPLHNHYTDLVYRTGDLGKYNHLGELLFIGRKDSQVKHMGHRIELGEIETVCNSISGISNCCILYENNKITCFYECNNPNINENEIKNILAKALPKYMHPHNFFNIDVMPLNSNGKIDRLQLKKFLKDYL